MERLKTLRAFRIKNNAPMCSGRLVYLVSMNLYLFTRQPPTSRHSRSDSVIVIGVGITVEQVQHWAQGYHRDMQASSRDYCLMKSRNTLMHSQSLGCLPGFLLPA